MPFNHAPRASMLLLWAAVGLAGSACEPTRVNPSLNCTQDGDCPADGQHRCNLAKKTCELCDGGCPTADAGATDTGTGYDSGADAGKADSGDVSHVDTGLAIDASITDAGLADTATASDTTGK